MALPLIPTTLVGSYPQPDWLVDKAELLSHGPPRTRMLRARGVFLAKRGRIAHGIARFHAAPDLPAGSRLVVDDHHGEGKGAASHRRGHARGSRADDKNVGLSRHRQEPAFPLAARPASRRRP